MPAVICTLDGAALCAAGVTDASLERAVVALALWESLVEREFVPRRELEIARAWQQALKI